MPRTILTMLNPVHNPKSMKRLPYFPHFDDNETVLVKMGNSPPCLAKNSDVVPMFSFISPVGETLNTQHTHPQVSSVGSNSFTSPQVETIESETIESASTSQALESQVPVIESASTPQTLVSQIPVSSAVAQTQPVESKCTRSGRIVRPPIKLNL
ncbi:hypothetical protein ACJJTC_008677 [Scirpophaga incertulas]